MLGIKTKVKRSIAHCIAATWASPQKNTLEELAFKKKYKVYIPTYENSNQIVHPDILLQSQAPHYVLAFTPYPNTNDKYENPSIAVSEDGIHFKEEKEGLNPLVPAPEKDHNDDPDLSYHDGLYQLLYLETVRPDYQNLMLLTSTDRINWNKEILHSEPLKNGGKDGFMLSPAIVYKENECFLFAVKKDFTEGNSLFATKGNSLKSIVFENEVKLNLSGVSKEFQPWHVDVFKDDKDGYVMLLCMVSPYSSKKKKYALFVATSKNLSDWAFQQSPVITNCYRSSGFVRDGVLYIYFSSNVYADVWKTGLYKSHLYSKSY
ncbi:MAG: hypothetical protein IJ530_04925 [Treponema sp.]|uniref:hypothetical protein n=1 Tax=Treponema sp. TaxID=166 RepID=UPI0025F96E3B|nr:hypothetical protein [Treponema sp.]MBQ8679088.1 hypothetical protein [Treponema sp.]